MVSKIGGWQLPGAPVLLYSEVKNINYIILWRLAVLVKAER